MISNDSSKLVDDIILIFFLEYDSGQINPFL